jgi:hypothetical protein
MGVSGRVDGGVGERTVLPDLLRRQPRKKVVCVIPFDKPFFTCYDSGSGSL